MTLRNMDKSWQLTHIAKARHGMLFSFFVRHCTYISIISLWKTAASDDRMSSFWIVPQFIFRHGIIFGHTALTLYPHSFLFARCPTYAYWLYFPSRRWGQQWRTGGVTVCIRAGPMRTKFSVASIHTNTHRCVIIILHIPLSFCLSNSQLSYTGTLRFCLLKLILSMTRLR
jgi:hypothetical protein